MNFQKIEIGICSPTYNEEKNILGFLNDISKLDHKFKINICFVDDGSKDKTIDLISKNKDRFNKVKIIKRIKKTNMTAVYSAYNEGLIWLNKNTKSLYFGQIDSDRVCSSNDIIKSFNKLSEKNNLDMVKLSKYSGYNYDKRSISRVILSKFYSGICKFFYGADISDYSTGIRFYKKNFLTQLINKKKRFTSPIGLLDDLLWAKNKNFKILELPFKIKEREYGSSFFAFKIIFKLAFDFIICIIVNKFND